MIDEKNSERKVIVENIYNQALTMMTDEPIEVLYHPDWHKGVLGIVAGRLLEQFHKPIIMLAEEEGILRGSARSIENFNIFWQFNLSTSNIQKFNTIYSGISHHKLYGCCTIPSVAR
ncbi:hypothetical protein N568_0108430 [Lactococcus garvieae TRF1]|uniref:DHHA1 domain-containing protein n=1 Tax=Lactococcus garvieae TRF1 TaxID=1380772 RepID=V8ANA3_9LACT|nr:hypothetical protein N568_0108430 [Lactococcus garvieae TRF1]